MKYLLTRSTRPMGLLLAVALLFSFSARANSEKDESTDSGNVTGNGGDSCALEFKSQMYHLLASFYRMKAASTYGQPRGLARVYKGVALVYQGISEKIPSTKVVCVNEALFIKGQSKDAINLPSQNSILVNRPTWEKLTERSDLTMAKALVLHEFLGLINYDTGDSYHFSLSLLAFIEQFIPELDQ